jgi:DNA/RNA endonuclease G (NUC1)
MDKRKWTIGSVFLCLLFPLLAPALAVTWPTWDNAKPEPHTVFAVPEYANHDPNHNVVREYSAFTVYYDDEVLAPRWTAIKMTHHVADKNNKIKRSPRFKIDQILRKKGYEVTKHDDYKNPTGQRSGIETT